MRGKGFLFYSSIKEDFNFVQRKEYTIIATYYLAYLKLYPRYAKQESSS